MIACPDCGEGFRHVHVCGATRKDYEMPRRPNQCTWKKWKPRNEHKEDTWVCCLTEGHSGWHKPPPHVKQSAEGLWVDGDGKTIEQRRNPPPGKLF